MTEPRRNQVARQLKQHLDALRNAGVEMVPITARPFQSPSTLFAQQPEAPGTEANRRQALEVLRVEVASCDRCPELFSTRTQTVFGVGPLTPEICFVGEAPGADEDRLGEPFVGAAGQLLNKIIAAMGLRRDEVYICNTLKCRPPNNRTPSPTETANCRGFFERQLDLIRPKYLCCLGGVAAQNVLNTKTGITKLRGRFYEYRGIPVLCTFHPAYLLRNPAGKRDVWIDMQLLLKTMGRPVPNSKVSG